ncbi:signal recognition [Cyclospora cayetanensis]|uniref:Signal recognition particle subunit SRP68 n=1 Tax=Cyclospora cayetanensis TaxID=88456 RepID=A0A1D3D7S3_9EIME|nr:signal recognition [Cyclospora cayetanensis]
MGIDAEDSPSAGGSCMPPPEATPAGPLSLDITYTAHVLGDLNGLRHRDYTRYRSYLTRRLGRLRRHLDAKHGRHRYVPKPLPDIITDERYLLLVLLQAERAWAYGMQLKSDNASAATPSAKLRAHSIRRFAKALLYARQLEALYVDDEGPLCDGRTCLDALAYRGTPVDPKKEKPRAAMSAALANWKELQLLPLETLRTLAAAAATDMKTMAPTLTEADAQIWAEQYGEASARFRDCVELVHKEMMADPEESSWLHAQGLCMDMSRCLEVERDALMLLRCLLSLSAADGRSAAAYLPPCCCTCVRLLRRSWWLWLSRVLYCVSSATSFLPFSQGLEQMQGEEALPDERRPQLQRWIQIAKDGKATCLATAIACEGVLSDAFGKKNPFTTTAKGIHTRLLPGALSLYRALLDAPVVLHLSFSARRLYTSGAAQAAARVRVFVNGTVAALADTSLPAVRDCVHYGVPCCCSLNALVQLRDDPHERIDLLLAAIQKVTAVAVGQRMCRYLCALLCKTQNIHRPASAAVATREDTDSADLTPVQKQLQSTVGRLLLPPPEPVACKPHLFDLVSATLSNVGHLLMEEPSQDARPSTAATIEKGKLVCDSYPHTLLLAAVLMGRCRPLHPLNPLTSPARQPPLVEVGLVDFLSPSGAANPPPHIPPKTQTVLSPFSLSQNSFLFRWKRRFPPSMKKTSKKLSVSCNIYRPLPTSISLLLSCPSLAAHHLPFGRLHGLLDCDLAPASSLGTLNSLPIDKPALQTARDCSLACPASTTRIDADVGEGTVHPPYKVATREITVSQEEPWGQEAEGDSHEVVRRNANTSRKTIPLRSTGPHCGGRVGHQNTPVWRHKMWPPAIAQADDNAARTLQYRIRGSCAAVGFSTPSDNTEATKGRRTTTLFKASSYGSRGRNSDRAE